MKRRLVCVSNRIQLPKKNAAPGGLAVGVLDALRRAGGLWFGWSGELCTEEPCEPELSVIDGITYATVELRRDQFERYYSGFANDALWPLFHHMPGLFRFRTADWQAYQNVNHQFASMLVPLLQPDDLIWVHDYHHVPLARQLREQGVRSPIGLFLHIPFPYIETLRVLPTYAELVRDMMAFDVIGFQTHADEKSFHACAAHVFGESSITGAHRVSIGGRHVATGVFPIGVDVESLQNAAQHASADDVVSRMMASLLGRRLMIGVDRLDYSKGLVERFAAYEHFLERFPGNRGRITYLQIAPLSRKDMTSYVEIRRALEQAAGRTNGRYGDTDWTPIRYINRNIRREKLMGLMRAADVGLVTPLRDGMNLVAKEFLAAQDPEDPGVLVLSTLAGAARELTAAVQVNPYDTTGVGDAIQLALTMPLSERRSRHAELLAVLRRNDINAWSTRFLDMLQSAS
jgi:trehalose 6-phosphate synthase